MIRLVGVLFIVFAVNYASAFAAQCADGYYPLNGQCTECGQAYYCHDDQRYDCRDVMTSPDVSWYGTVVNGTYDSKVAYSPDQCNCEYLCFDERHKWAVSQRCNQQPVCDGTGTTYVLRPDWCYVGYWATGYISTNQRYTNCAPCTNGPAHSHYTGYGTLGASGRAENNCAWECDDGYVELDGTCVEAVKCPAGQYPVNNQCVACNTRQAFYCPGGTSDRVPCPTDTTDWLTLTGCDAIIRRAFYSFGRGYSGIPSEPDDCVAQLELDCGPGVMYLENFYRDYVGDYSCPNCTRMWKSAKAGYYLSGRMSTGMYSSVHACTNAPANAIYTGAGAGTNDCPWACDDGYGRHGDECLSLCHAGFTTFKTQSGIAMPVWANRITTPSLVLRRDTADACYVNLYPTATPVSGAINIEYNNQIYYTAE